MIATSTTHPIELGRLQQDVHGLRGTLSLTLAPGKVGPGSSGIQWQRDLVQDLIRLRDHHKVDTVVTLLERDEMARYGIANLLQEARRLGLRTRHYPIPDRGVPDSTVALVKLVSGIIAEIRQGRHVVVHCLGGVGRAGTVACCVLVALGCPADEALARVRAIRIGAVETAGQEKFVRTFTFPAARRSRGKRTRDRSDVFTTRSLEGTDTQILGARDLTGVMQITWPEVGAERRVTLPGSVLLDTTTLLALEALASTHLGPAVGQALRALGPARPIVTRQVGGVPDAPGPDHLLASVAGPGDASAVSSASSGRPPRPPTTRPTRPGRPR
jgi:ADP-ribosyl-[dinitrogen reductase] hydrolase